MSLEKELKKIWERNLQSIDLNSKTCYEDISRKFRINKKDVKKLMKAR